MFQPRQLLLQEDLLRASPADSRSLLMICAGVYVLLPIRKPPFLQPEALLFARADFRGRSVGHFGSGNSGHLRLESPAPRGSYCSFISLLGPCLFRLLLACLISENPAPKLSPLDPLVSVPYFWPCKRFLVLEQRRLGTMAQMRAGPVVPHRYRRIAATSHGCSRSRGGT